MTPPFLIELLGPDHDRSGFSCGSEPLDRYFRERASQDVRRRVSVCFVAVDAATRALAGYYTLAAASVPLTDLAEGIAKKLPRYPSVPAARIGRLAIATGFQGRRLGAALLWDAATRATRSGMGVVALVVDAKDETAAAFYRHHGFSTLGSDPLTLVLPVASLARDH